jgi:transcriptional regulator with XRE-family HTH domain
MRPEQHAGHPGQLLRLLRDANELTVRDAATLVRESGGVKCSPSYLNQVELGKRDPSMRWVATVAAVLARRLREDRAA